MLCRRDSFITHRAFCDAIAEENKTSVQGQGVVLMSNNLGQQSLQQGGQLVSGGELMIPASVPMSNTETATANPSTSSKTSNHFDHFDTKNPNLTLVPQGVPSNMLLSSPRSGLHNNSLSSSTSSALFHNHHGHQALLPSSISGHLSATELLLKASQMGATMSSNYNYSGMSMAPSTYGDFSRYVNNQFMQQKNGNNIPVQQTSSQFFGASNGNMGMFSGLLFDQSNRELMKNMEQSVNGRNNNNNNNNTSNGLSLHGKNVSSGGDTMTVDFLGVGRERGGGGGGGGNRPESFHDHQQRQVLHDEQQRQIKQQEEDDDQSAANFGWSWG